MSPSQQADATALTAVVELLLAQPTEHLTVGQLQEQIVAVTPVLGRLEGWLRAREGQLHALSAGQLPTEDGGSRSVAGWLADVRNDTCSAAGSRLRTSTLLRDHLPLVADAVVDGVLTAAQAQVLTRLVGKIDDHSLRESQPSLIAVAAELDPVVLGAWVSDKIATFCEPALEADERSGQARRYLQTRREHDGALRGSFVVSREDSEALLTVLEPLARKTEAADDRTAGQRRADALVEVFESALRTGELGDAGGLRPQLHYVLPADWAADQRAKDTCADCGPRCSDHRPTGFDDAVAGDLPDHLRPGTAAPRPTASSGCARAAWSGPQTRARVEALLCDARISRVLLDRTGQVRGLESLTDTITPSQRRMLAVRDGGCVARRCRRAAAMCDAHHLWSRADGGPTCLDNLVLLCRRHHVQWHQGRLSHRDLRIPWHPSQRDVGTAPSGWPAAASSAERTGAQDGRCDGVPLDERVPEVGLRDEPPDDPLTGAPRTAA